MTDLHLRSVIVRVTIDGKEVVTRADGDSMTGVPATTDMHFRNGAVAISYVSTLLLQLVDEGKVSLDDKLSKWLPDMPNADRVTLGQLAQMTSGYVDYVIGNTELNNALYADPFRQWTPEELLAYAVSQPLLYEPGTNWNYAHTNYVLLGLALEKATGEAMPKLLRRRCSAPGADQHRQLGHPGDPRAGAARVHLANAAGARDPSGTPFYEESTFWNPSWTITHGAIQTTNIYDMEASAVAFGTGKLFSESFDKMTSTALRQDDMLPGCDTCAVQSERYTATARHRHHGRLVHAGSAVRARPGPSPTCRRRRWRSRSRSR